MLRPPVVVTGSCGTIGSEVAEYFGTGHFRVVGIHNNTRAELLALGGVTAWNLCRLQSPAPEATL